MERYFRRKASCPAEDEINWDAPVLRKEIDSNHPNLREKVRKKFREWTLSTSHNRFLFAKGWRQREAKKIYWRMV